jgi:hypothetical protein
VYKGLIYYKWGSVFVMRRDSLKTLGAILLILIIVGVTFWYGNKQRQAQVKSDQQASQQQAKKASQSTKPDPAPAPVAPATPPVVSTVSPAPTATPQTGSGIEVILPVVALIGGFQLKRASAKALKRSLLTV